MSRYRIRQEDTVFWIEKRFLWFFWRKVDLGWAFKVYCFCYADAESNLQEVLYRDTPEGKARHAKRTVHEV